MLFLPAAALCCLCSALVVMAAELIQDQLSLTRRAGQTVSFSCAGTDQCGIYIFWFQKKETETFTVILSIDKKEIKVNSGYNHPQEADFSAVNNQNGWVLQIQKVNPSHAATYYCACWTDATHSEKFGSGTKLIVTDEQVVKPVVSVYPAAYRAHLEGNSSLLCLASAMFPPLVRFSWKRQKENGQLEELPSAGREQLELRESGRTAAILLVHQPENSTYKYRCYVEHEGGRVEAQTEQEVPAPAASCPPEREPADLPAVQQADLVPLVPLDPLDPVQSECRVKLLCLLYTVLIVKSLLYCCGLSLLMSLRNKGPSTCCSHAD
ncbi:immunoglobulin lambda-1 light chain-like [Mastacembelus armatus]|uniref:immunoglobulin lambda-1 light chain-like n=1 Tax=Mastacembelus armatus TaxID=205130 RepID=UPI000E4596F7|nr:immunoglobulin lambda-1 light chain-like [Mastacembelus armatus]